MQIEQLFLLFLNSLSYGLLLFLLASGLSLIFGLMGVVNLAHGSYYMLGAFIGVSTFKMSGSFLLALGTAALSTAIIGYITERFFLRILYKKELEQVLLTFGFSYIWIDICKWIWGGTPLSFPKPALLNSSVHFLGTAFPVYRIALIITGLLTALALWLFLEKTKTGVIVKAGVDDKEMVTGMGINIKFYFSLIFTLGAFLAAFGGVLGGPVIGVYTGIDSEILIIALAVVVCGGLGTLKGAFSGSILIGFIDTLGKVFFANYSVVTIYVVMAVILLVKPNGLFGKGEA